MIFVLFCMLGLQRKKTGEVGFGIWNLGWCLVLDFKFS